MFGSAVKMSERIKLEGVRGIGSMPKEKDKEVKESTSKLPLQRRAQAQPSQAK
jgi:hypothetical protein